MQSIQISSIYMDVLWAGLRPDVEKWLYDNDISYGLLDCDEQGRMILTLDDADAVAFKLRWI